MPIEPQHVLRVIHYYDFFKHPLHAKEILQFVEVRSNLQQCSALLQEMCISGLLSFKEGYYFLPGKDELVERRQKNLPINEFLLLKADKISPVLRNVPFVRAFGLSGSLSKKGATPEADIDFFIITAPKRVWLVKAILKFYKRLFLHNEHKFMCNNYVLSEAALHIEEQNIFQAMEVATLIPLYGEPTFKNFFETNQWVNKFFPNNKRHIKQLNESTFFSKNLLETLFSGNIGHKINNWSLKRFKKHADTKFSANNTHSKLTFMPEVSRHFPINSEIPILTFMKDLNLEQSQIVQVVN